MTFFEKDLPKEISWKITERYTPHNLVIFCQKINFCFDSLFVQNSHFCTNGIVSSSNQIQCVSSVSSDDCHSLQLGGGMEGATIAVRGSITLSSGRYLPSMNANHPVNLPLSYGEPSTPPCSSSSYTSLSSATPTLSSLLNTPSLHNQSLNLLKCVNTSSPSTPVSSRTTSSHCPNSILPCLIKNKNIVAANPLLAGNRSTVSIPPIIVFTIFHVVLSNLQKNSLRRQPRCLRRLARH